MGKGRYPNRYYETDCACNSRRAECFEDDWQNGRRKCCDDRCDCDEDRFDCHEPRWNCCEIRESCCTPRNCCRPREACCDELAELLKFMAFEFLTGRCRRKY